ncbi:uncharacterized protein TNIN_443721 [Trichonephila inaurata madagascariensis]|uniref:Gustatory receptor n=1 Tax=Trichonephila inaurata madagascariensis TaxID=2747483 RepID=A0A8X6I4K8_9ARAC|nr:uncharacterized protein TNIN_443721 [Trichonephila inaurata madagascariensis]
MKPQFAWSNSRNQKSPTAFSEFKFITLFLRLSGISISTLQQPSSPWSIISTGLSASVWVISFSFIASEILFCGATNYVETSVVTFNIFVLVSSCVLWVIVQRRSRQFVQLLEDIADTHACVSKKWNLNLRKIIIVLFAYICFIPFVTSLPSLITVQEDSLRFYLHCYLYGTELTGLGNFGKITLLFTFLTVENFLHFFFPNVVVVLIFFLCECQNQMVASYSEKLPRRLMADKNNTNVDKMVQLYAKLRKDFVNLRDLTSLPISLILTQKILSLFFSLTVLLSKNTKSIFVEIIESTCYIANAILGLILVILSASKIRETHSKIREQCLDASLRLPRDSKSLELLYLLKSFVEREDLTMTAAGIVLLKRSLFIKLGASMITYGVIIVQLDSAKKD